MNLVNFFDKFTGWIRNPFYLSNIPEGIEIYRAENFRKASKRLAEIIVSPGWAVFFWNRKTNYIDHIAIVSEQQKEDLNLLKAKLIHGSPPPVGKAYGPLSSPVDYSGIRTASVIDYLESNPNIYSRVIVGVPPNANEQQVALAGEIANKVGSSGLILGKPAFYSFQVLNKFLFVKWFDYKNHSLVKLAVPYWISQKILGNPLAWNFTYCGDLVGQIYSAAGIARLPKAKVLIFSGYRSSTFYEWFRENRSLKSAIVWKKRKSLLF